MPSGNPNMTGYAGTSSTSKANSGGVMGGASTSSMAAASKGMSNNAGSQAGAKSGPGGAGGIRGSVSAGNARQSATSAAVGSRSSSANGGRQSGPGGAGGIRGSVSAGNARQAQTSVGVGGGGNARSIGQRMANAAALSRGPGVTEGRNPGSSVLAQNRTALSLGLSLGEMAGKKFGTKDATRLGSQFAKTIAGEAGNLSAPEQAAVARAMVNRLALAVSTGRPVDFDSLLKGFDANGMRFAATNGRSGVKANSGYLGAKPGTDSFAAGLDALANGMSPYGSLANAPDFVQNATHYLNKDATLAISGRLPGWAKDTQAWGPHSFGAVDPGKGLGKVADARQAMYGGTLPSDTLNQVAGLDPRGSLQVANRAAMGKPPGLGLDPRGSASVASFAAKGKPDLRGMTNVADFAAKGKPVGPGLGLDVAGLDSRIAAARANMPDVQAQGIPQPNEVTRAPSVNAFIGNPTGTFGPVGKMQDRITAEEDTLSNPYGKMQDRLPQDNSLGNPYGKMQDRISPEKSQDRIAAPSGSPMATQGITGRNPNVVGGFEDLGVDRFASYPGNFPSATGEAGPFDDRGRVTNAPSIGANKGLNAAVGPQITQEQPDFANSPLGLGLSSIGRGIGTGITAFNNASKMFNDNKTAAKIAASFGYNPAGDMVKAGLSNAIRAGQQGLGNGIAALGNLLGSGTQVAGAPEGVSQSPLGISSNPGFSMPQPPQVAPQAPSTAPATPGVRTNISQQPSVKAPVKGVVPGWAKQALLGIGGAVVPGINIASMGFDKLSELKNAGKLGGGPSIGYDRGGASSGGGSATRPYGYPQAVAMRHAAPAATSFDSPSALAEIYALLAAGIDPATGKTIGA